MQLVVDQYVDSGWGEQVFSRTTRPLADAIEDYNSGMPRDEALKRAAAYIEHLWDEGIVLIHSADYLHRRSRLPALIVMIVFALGMIAGNLDPLDITPS